MPVRRPRPRASACEVIALAFLTSPAALVVTDARRRIVAANRAYERLGGRCGLAVPDAAASASAAGSPSRSLAPGVCRGASPRARRAVGRRVALQVLEACHVGSSNCECGAWRYRAEHDPLTGLPNRHQLESELARALARANRHAQHLAVMFMDLDGFKAINDSQGHASGDRLIRRVGALLRDTLRGEDLVARYGGDEFVVVLETPHRAADAATVAATLLDAVRSGARSGESGDPAITASIGVALYPDHAGDAAGLLVVADAAMYCAKRAGGNAFAFGDAPGAQPAWSQPGR